MRPLIIASARAPTVQAALQGDLAAHYGDGYAVVAPAREEDVDACLRDARRRNLPVALVLLDSRDLLQGVDELHPDAKRVLICGFAEAEQGLGLAAIEEGTAHHYVVAPWDPAAERLHPAVDELLDDWARGYMVPFQGVRVVGHRWSPESHEIRELLARYQVPYQWLDVERDAEGRRVLAASGSNEGASASEWLPLVILPDGTTLRHPTVTQLAAALGLVHQPKTENYDVIIVGAGPAGLAAATYAASEGLHAVVVEDHAPGGQAAQSARIENYLGFPSGLSGTDLVRRAMDQARRFGADVVSLTGVRALEVRDPYRVAHLADGRAISAEAVVLACGVSYRQLDAAGAAPLTNRGIYYGAGNADAPFCAGERVGIVGGGNSAGQAALNFVRYSHSVELLVRGDRLDRRMSAYLVDRISHHPGINVRLTTEVVRCHGEEEGWLNAVDVFDTSTGEVQRLPLRLLFVFIGAEPHSEWLHGTVARDDHGFLLTGAELRGHAVQTADGTREPYALECSVPGVFAAGDVRARSIKRIAAAVGEGSMAVSYVHHYLDR